MTVYNQWRTITDAITTFIGTESEQHQQQAALNGHSPERRTGDELEAPPVYGPRSARTERTRVAVERLLDVTR